MPVDTSIYANAAPPPPNPLAMAGQVASFQNAQNQNRLFQQEFGANKAYGNIIQQATDPTTGQTDFNRANALAAQNPATAFKAPEFAAQALARQQAQTGLDASKVDLYNKHLDTVSQTITPLLTLGKQGSLTLPDVYKALGNLVADKNSQIGVSDIQPILGELPTQGPNGGPPTNAQLMQVVTQFALRNENSRAQLAAINGTPMAVAHGGGTAVIAPSTVTGQTTMLGDIANTTSPGEKMARIPTFVAGQPGSIPQGAIADQYGNPIAPGAQPAASGSSPLGTGRYPAQAPPGASSTAAAGGPAGFVASGPKLGAGVAADKTAGASADQGIVLQQTADSVPQRKALLGNLESALNNFTSGPVADWKKVGESLANSVNPFGNINLKGIASQEEFAKQATQLAQSQFQALGGTGTDAKLDSAMHTSPNTALSPMGNKGIINMLKGNEDAIAAKNAEWQSYKQKGNGPEDYARFSVEFNKNFDPRVFQSVYMSPDDRQDLLKGLDKSEKSQFQQSYNYAVQRGWIPDPRAANATQ